ALGEMAMLLEAIERRISGPTLLFPLDDTALWMSNEIKLGENWIIIGPRHANATLALDKLLQTQLAREVGFNVPHTTVATSQRQALALCSEVGFPIILKPVACVPVINGRKLACRKWICAGTQELETALKEWGQSVPLLLQPYIVGSGEGVFGL